jgi:hypothetical protein
MEHRSEMCPYPSRVQVAITRFTTSYGSDLSAITVTSRDASSSTTSAPIIGRVNTALSASMRGEVAARISSMLAIRSPCTSSSSVVIITTTDAFGFSSACDNGTRMSRLFCTTSTSAEYTSRNATITDMMSISGIRFSSTSSRRGRLALSRRFTVRLPRRCR